MVERLEAQDLEVRKARERAGESPGVTKLSASSHSSCSVGAALWPWPRYTTVVQGALFVDSHAAHNGRLRTRSACSPLASNTSARENDLRARYEYRSTRL